MFPYAIFQIITGNPDWTMGNKEKFEDILVQFSIFCAPGYSAVEIHTIFKNLKALFDEAALSITGYTTIWMRRGPDHGPFPDEDKIWNKTVDYSVYIEA